MVKWKDSKRDPEVQAEINDIYDRVKDEIESMVHNHCSSDIRDIPETRMDDFIKALADDVWYDLISQAYEDMSDLDKINYARELLSEPERMLEWLYEDNNRFLSLARFYSRKKHRD